jgi:hypothetical protein
MLHRPRRLTRSLLLAAIGAAACADDVAPFNRLEGLRVLAIKSDPVVPGPGEETTLSALVFTPGEEKVTYEWSWCPVAGQTGQPCPVSLEDLAGLGGGGPGPGAPPAAATSDAGATSNAPDAGAASDAGATAPAADAGATGDGAGAAPMVAMPPALPSLDLGTAETAKLRVTLPRELLMQLCTVPMGAQMAAMARGFGSIPPRCNGGFPVQIKLVAKTDKATVTAVRTLRLELEGGDRHANPAVAGLAARIEGDERTLDDTVVLPRLRQNKLVARAAEGASEPYTERDDLGNPMPSRERLWFTWFVETGDTKYERTSFIEGMTTLEQFQENEWRPAQEKDFPGEIARVFVVVHDNRGGVGWKGTTVKLGAPVK